LLLVFASEAVTLRAIRVAHEPTTLGRGHAAWEGLDDNKLSREHAQVGLVDLGVTVRDLHSRNGTFVGGERVGRAGAVAPFGGVIRIGRSVLLVVADTLPFEDLASLEHEELIVGPTMRRLLDTVRLHAVRSRTLLVRGETGTGKELAARRFWSGRAGAAGPFVAVNCSTITANLAERLLFGAVRGAYSGAETQTGYIQAADGGVLFLDEFGELPLDVQAKLLRTLETGEVTMLGATRPSIVDVRFCFATHRDLRAAVTAGTFRADLYYRVALPEIVLPPIRERVEEIAWHVARICIAERCVPAAALIDACMRRLWPGNVRELCAAVRDACSSAVAAHENEVDVDRLAPDVGMPLDGEVESTITRARLENALASAKGNIANAARTLGLHRTQLYRLMARHGIARDR
jgi:transcriptional regulator with GAF, ATPase, and Fis domain